MNAPPSDVPVLPHELSAADPASLYAISTSMRPSAVRTINVPCGMPVQLSLVRQDAGCNCGYATVGCEAPSDDHWSITSCESTHSFTRSSSCHTARLDQVAMYKSDLEAACSATHDTPGHLTCPRAVENVYMSRPGVCACPAHRIEKPAPDGKLAWGPGHPAGDLRSQVCEKSGTSPAITDLTGSRRSCAA